MSDKLAREKKVADEIAELQLLLRNNQHRREDVEAHHGELLRELNRVREQLRLAEQSVEAFNAVMPWPKTVGMYYRVVGERDAAERERDEARSKLALTEAWALDERQKRHAVEDNLVAERSKIALAERALEEHDTQDVLKDAVIRVARHAENSNSQIPGAPELSYIGTSIIQELTDALAALDATSPREDKS